MAEPVVPAPIEGQPKVEDNQPIPPAWRNSLPEEHRTAETLKKFDGKDWNEVGPKLAVSYINLEKMPRGVTVPKDGAKPEEWDAFYEKLGRPKTAEEYGIELKVPENVMWNPVAEKTILKKAHERGLTKPQAEGLLNDYLAIAAEGQTRLRQDTAKEIEGHYETIRQEWGGLTDRNLALVQRHVSEFGGAPFKEYLDETGLGNDPRFLKYALAAAQPMLESNLIRGEGLGMKRAEAKAEIDALMATKEWAAGDKPTLERIRALYPVANSE